jgi:hypothetical protein
MRGCQAASGSYVLFAAMTPEDAKISATGFLGFPLSVAARI